MQGLSPIPAPQDHHDDRDGGIRDQQLPGRAASGVREGAAAAAAAGDGGRALRIGRDEIERREVRRSKTQSVHAGGDVDVLDVRDPLLAHRSCHRIVPVGQGATAAAGNGIRDGHGHRLLEVRAAGTELIASQQGGGRNLRPENLGDRHAEIRLTSSRRHHERDVLNPPDGRRIGPEARPRSKATTVLESSGVGSTSVVVAQ